jgi:hypothetical protein
VDALTNLCQSVCSPLAGDTADLTLEAASDIALPPSNPSTPGPRGDQGRTAPSPGSEPTVTIIDREAKSFSFLIRPENFLELPQQDVPGPFREEQPEQISRKGLLEALHDGHYRAAAFIAGHLLQACNDTDHEAIFRLLYVRFACLQIVGLHAQAAQESKSMQDVTLAFFRDRGKHLMPWELRVLVVRLQAIGFNDWRRGIMSYYELAREARFEARRAPAAERQMWTTRLRDLGLRVANALIETKDLQGAIQHLKTLSIDGEDAGVMKTRMALLYLRCGDVDAAKRCFELTDEHSRFLHPLCTMADGDFTKAASLWAAVKSNIDEAADEAATLDQAIAICKLYDGQVHEVCRHAHLSPANTDDYRLERYSRVLCNHMVPCVD